MSTPVIEKPRILERLATRYKPNASKKARETKRIELLGSMDDRHKRALAAGDKGALLELAAEYMVLGQHGGCPTMANQILAEAESL